ncbi:WXG100 family type VII secretion target [Nocardioides nanhaiensis]|uniref:WXG100 family type VII secretion target n=1 Tax=Nocardioides nanhaiensis TaxID=1476871 RepID=A0ABP8WBW7_9ACTN
MGNTDFGQGEGTLTQAADLVTTAMTDFERLAQRLTDQISALQGKWGGQGAQAFQTLYTAWEEKQGVIVRALNGFADSLGATERLNYEQEDLVVQSTSQLTAGLDATAKPPVLGA